MKDRGHELRAAARANNNEAVGEDDVLAKIANDAGTGSRVCQAAPCDHQHQRAGPLAENLVRDATFAKDGKVVCVFQSAQKFKTRNATFGFSDAADLDEGAMWPVAFALTEPTGAEEKRISALVKNAVS